MRSMINDAKTRQEGGGGFMMMMMMMMMVMMRTRSLINDAKTRQQGGGGSIVEQCPTFLSGFATSVLIQANIEVLIIGDQENC